MKPTLLLAMAFLGGLFVEAMATTAIAQEEAPQLQFRLFHTTDQIETEIDAELATLSITSPRGIGRLEVTKEAGPWPETIEIRLAINALEGVTLSTSTVQLHSFLGSLQTEVRRLNEETGEWESQGDDRMNLYELAISVDDQTGCIVVELPRNLLGEDLDTFQLQWVDYYR